MAEGAVFARVQGGDVAGLEAAILEVRRSTRRSGPLGVLAFDPAQHDFAVVDRWGSSDDLPGWFEDPPGSLDAAVELARLSSACGEVVAECSVDAELCLFAHWRDGELVRSLTWSEGRWASLQGEPQAWEAGLFDQAWLDASLEVATWARPDPAKVEAVKAAFAVGRLVEGSPWPTLITAAVNVSSVLRARLRVPPYGFSPWPRRRDVLKGLPG